MIARVVRTLTRWSCAPLAWLVAWRHRRVAKKRPVVHLVVRRVDGLQAASEVVRRVRALALDPRVRTVWIEMNEPLGGWALTHDLAEAFEAVKAAGKHLVAWVPNPTHRTLYAVAMADEIWVPPVGDVALLGVGAELTFGGRALERLGLTPDFEAAGAYKSFGEPFTRTYASAANREATEALLADLHTHLVAALARGRGIEVDAVKAAMADAPLSVEEAAARGLVDGGRYRDVLVSSLEEEVGEAQAFDAWSRRWRLMDWVAAIGRRKHVAVVHLEGAIVDEEQGGRTAIRPREVCDALDGLRELASVDAVVLHVSSPGGSALASDTIWRSVARLAESKPVVASYADVSASGGVYLSAAAHEIVVRPTTITGSIGVFGGKLVAAGAMRKLGVTHQGLRMAPHALMLSASTPFSDSERVAFRASLQRMYDGFVERVAQGRGVDAEAIEPLCRGRVWSGSAALTHGLVDRIGGLDVAISQAAARATLAPGSFHVVDVHVGPHPWVQRMQRALRPSWLGSVSRLGASVLPSGWWSVVSTHPARPLMLLPWTPPGLEDQGSP